MRVHQSLIFSMAREFVLTGVTKPTLKQNQEFQTLPNGVRIVKSREKRIKTEGR